MKQRILAAINDPGFGDLPVGELQKLGKRLAKTPQALETAPVQCRVALLAGFTTSYLAELLPLMLLRRGIGCTLYEAPFGAMTTEILDPGSGYHRFEPALTFLLPSHRDLAHAPGPDADAAGSAAAVEAEAAHWRQLWERISGPIVQLAFDPPPIRPLGEGDGLHPGGGLRHGRAVNLALADAAPGRVGFVDAEHLATRLGADVWHDARLYHLTKQPCSMEALPALATALAAATAGMLGRGRKGLVLDLDNTLWGGEVGDVGIEGLTLGPETPEGESFTAFQNYVKSLERRGVILAVCSKNQEALAKEPFERHGAMVLGLDDIACFIANFDDKASNLAEIAKRLNVGLDALVFADDSPVECAWIREALPEVQVIELAGDPADFPGLIDRADPFPVARLTGEDLARAESYQAMGRVADGLARAADIDSFLSGLEAQAVIETVRPDTIDRLVQLVAKTNQFKLNPTIFTPDEIEASDGGVLAIRFKDRLQDYGIVAVAVTETDGETLVIRNWVMSCRVFSRRLEYLTRRLLGEAARKAGVERLRLTYVPSKKNGLIADLLPALGFAPAANGETFEAAAEPPGAMPETFATVTRFDENAMSKAI